MSLEISLVVGQSFVRDYSCWLGFANNKKFLYAFDPGLASGATSKWDKVIECFWEGCVHVECCVLSTPWGGFLKGIFIYWDSRWSRFWYSPLLYYPRLIGNMSSFNLKGHNSCSNLKLKTVSWKCHYKVSLFQLECTENLTSNVHTNVLSKIFCDVLYNINYGNVMYTKYEHHALVGDYLFTNFIFIKRHL